MAARSSDEPPGRGTPRGGPPTSGSLDETRLAPSASTPRPAPPSEGLPAHLDETHAPRGEASATSAARANPLDETCLAPATPRPARRGETLPATSSAGQLGETLPATSSAGQRGETLPSTPRPPSLDETRLAPSTSPRRRVDAPTPDLEATRLRGAAGGDDDPPPARIGRFLVLRQLGRGGMGVVYAAYDDHLDRRVAIKLLRDQGDGADDRLLREAQALARLSHPNVVGVYEVDRALESIYIAMEFVVGVTLREWLAARPRSRAEIVDVFLQAGRGLAAAHAVGLIHRDFKPDNVMVGDDGRVRVFDFGLARSLVEAPATIDGGAAASRVSGSSLDTDMTIAGTILGTPAYMAPEQFLALATDARTDVFSFCVALYEALHGRRPFDGATFEALRDAVCHGDFAPPPRDASVPTWLRARVLRGLAPSPADRWPTLDALLVALADDPSARRLRWLKASASMIAIAGVAVALVLGITALRARMQEQAREEAAALRWASIAERALAVDEAAASEARAEGDALFHAFTTAPEVRGTAALTEAWLARGRRFYERGDAERAMAAFASAYTGAPTPALERSTLLEIAALFRARWDIRALTPLVRFLGAPGGDASVTTIDPMIDPLRLDVALDHRDFPAAADLLDRLGDAAPSHLRGLQPALRRLAHATDLGPADNPFVHVVDLDGDGRDELLEYTPGSGSAPTLGELRVRDLDGGAPRTIATIPDIGALRMASGRPFGLVEHPTTNEWTVREISEHGAAERWRGRLEAGVMLAHADDLDGDGRIEIYVSLTAQRRGLFRIDPSTEGEPGRSPPTIVDPTIDRLNSDGIMITGDDLDRDGRRELVVGLGPWKGYDLRILRWAGEGYETVDHAEIGAVHQAVTLGAADGGRLLAAATGRERNRTVFPEPPHYETPGVHLFRLQGDRLVRGATLPPLSHPLCAGDVDGDGLDDLVYNGEEKVEGRRRLFLLRQGADGSFTPVALGFGDLVGLAQADDDPEREVIFKDGDHIWLLGHGPKDTIVRPDEQAPPRPPPPGLAEPALVAHWERADRLVSLGLVELAARSLVDLAQLVDAPLRRAYVLERAADLFARAGERRRAIEVLGEVAGDPVISAAAARLAAGHLAALGEYLAADAALPAGDRHPAADAFAPYTVDELHAIADPARRTVITFDRPLDPAWTFVAPASVRRDHVGGRLDVAATGLQGRWAALPLEHDGGPILVKVELDVTALEFGSELPIELVVGDEMAMHAALRSIGGSGALRRYLVDSTGFIIELGDSLAEAPMHLSITLAAAPASGRAAIFFDVDGALHRRDVRLRRPLADGPLRLAFGVDLPGDPLGQLRGALREVALIGLRPGPPSDDPYARGVASLVEGRFAEAVERLEGAPLPGPRERLALALAYAEVGRFADARAVVAALAADDTTPTLGHLAEHLRSRAAMRPVLLEALGSAIELVRVVALGNTLLQHREEPFARRLILEELDQLRTWDAQSAGASPHALQLLLARARVLREHGDLAEARLDLAAARRRLAEVPGDTAGLESALLREEARVLLATGDRAGARRLVEEALAIEVDRDLERGRIARDPTLRAAFDDDPAP